MKKRPGKHCRRRVCVVTGTRAEYGILRTCIKAIAQHAKLELQLIVTGMHLLRSCGHTIDQIISDGWSVDARVPMQKGTDDPLDQVEGLARGVQGIARSLELLKTDIVLVLGDRIEALAGAMAALTTGRFIAHVHGGDWAPGDVDQSIRNAITKIAHLHLAATQKACKRIARMGEESRRVHCVGAPGLDEILDLVCGWPGKRVQSNKALIIQHPCGRTAERERKAMNAILVAVRCSRLHPIIVYPNTDLGHTGVVQAIERYLAAHPTEPIEIHRSLPRGAFLQELIKADVLVGNSSAGIIEANVCGTPVVNVGDRQFGRERGGHSVIDAEESRDSILAAIVKAKMLRPRMGGRNVYGDGRAGQRIADLLAGMPITEPFRRKGSPSLPDLRVET